jgi:hypothetical protein
MTNEGQLPMMKNMLNSALKSGIPMNLFHCYILTTNKEYAVYSTPQFQKLTIKKLEVISQNMVEPLLWVDNDIVFFKNCLADIQSYKGTFVMQTDRHQFCTGFFYVQPTGFAQQYIKTCIKALSQISDPQINDQGVFNGLHRPNPFISKIKLPEDEYPNGEIFFVQKRVEKAKMVHCNFMQTTPEKIQRLKDHGLWDETDTGFNLVKKIYL